MLRISFPLSLQLIYLFAMLLSGGAVKAAVTGPFSAEQAKRGQALYERHCAACHGADLSGGNAVALRGDGFLSRWSGDDQSVGDLAYVITTTMPLGNAGILKPQQSLDIVTYMMAANGHTAGGEILLVDDPRTEELSVGTEAHRQMARQRGNRCPDVHDYFSENRPQTQQPDQRELTRGGDESDWLLPGRNYAGHRYSTLDKINRGNAHKLRHTCMYETGDTLGFQTIPLVRDGRLYFTTNTDTFAIDAATCEEIWKVERPLRCTELWQHSRGAALKDGYLVRGTPDGYLMAMNAETGETVWERLVNDSDVPGAGVPISPLIYKDRVVVAPSTSDIGINGWVRGYRLTNGELLWNFDVIPEPGTEAAKTWDNEEALKRGGGAIWTPLTLDTETETAYMATANPGPAFYPQVRGGDNLYTNTLLALDVMSGELRWYDQILPGDYHDWDFMHASPLFRAGDRDMVLAVGKDGYIHGIDRNSHERVYSVAVTHQENVDAPITPGSDTRFCPGIGGGMQFNAPALDPESNTLFVTAVEWCSSVRQTHEIRFVRGGLYMGGYFTMDPVEKAYGTLTAYRAADGERLWRMHSDRPVLAAVAATAGGLVLMGELNGNFNILDGDNGEKLYSFDTGAALNGGIITYEVDGRQYIAVAAGAAAPFWQAQPATGGIRIFTLDD
ncbi:MAG: PQQ-binding-like beta-propeller repeat protein [Gammaproteobacteria bacterium]